MKLAKKYIYALSLIASLFLFTGCTQATRQSLMMARYKAGQTADRAFKLHKDQFCNWSTNGASNRYYRMKTSQEYQAYLTVCGHIRPRLFYY